MPDNVDRLQTLSEISRVVSATLDLHRLYETIYQQIGRVMDTTQFYIALFHPDRNTVELPYHREEGKLHPPQEIPFGQSVTALVIERGGSLLFQDHEAYRQYTSSNGLPELTIGEDESQSKIWVPLNTGSRTIGALSVQSTRRHVYTQDDVQTLAIIASQAAVAIENANLYTRSLESVRQTQALLQVARVINGSLDLKTVLNLILVGMREVMPYYLAAILLPDHAGKHLDVVEVIGPLAEERRRSIKVRFGQGVTGTVFQRGEPLIVPNVRAFPGYIEHGIDAVCSEIAVPLKRGDTIIGVLDVERTECNAFSPQDLNLLSLFASQAAIAIENARLYTQERQRGNEIQTVANIVQELTQLSDVPSIATLINRELKQLIDYHACRLFCLDHATETLLPISQPKTPNEPATVRVGDGFVGWIAKHGRSGVIEDTLADPRVMHIPGTPTRSESVVGAPLIYEDQVQGVITLSKLGVNHFDENSLRVLEIIAAQTAIAFDRVRLIEQLRTDAITDHLLKVFNRRYLEERLTVETAKSSRHDHQLAAIMLDLDRFKRINDTFGHIMGDTALRDLARMISDNLRDNDVVARFGGEEFCVLLPDASLEEAARTAERLRRAVELHRLPEEAEIEHVTVSVGVAILQPEDQGIDLLNRADLAMYRSKYSGGNRVCVARSDGYEFADALAQPLSAAAVYSEA